VTVPPSTVFLEPVTTTNIDAGLNYVGFQGDFTFNETICTFSSPLFVEKAGLTSGNWNVSGNVLPGPGPIRTLRVSAFSIDFTPLSGSGVLYNLRMVRTGATPGSSTPLAWQPIPRNFLFVDASLDSHDATQVDGLITITVGAPTPTPTGTPGPATHFAVGAPPGVPQFELFKFVVTAQDQFNNTATGYTGTVHFTSTDGADLLVAYRRAANIVAIEEKKDGTRHAAAPDPALFDAAEEKDLAAALARVRPAVDAALKGENFTEAMRVLSTLRGPVDAFFDKVTVNAPDAKLRANRLRILAAIGATLRAVADFSRIEG
jgi:hypothetical protein